MAITIYGSTKRITLDTSTTWSFHDIYVAVQDWACLSTNMQYVLPCSSEGKADLGGGVYTDIIYKLLNSWKLKPSGYTNGDQIIVNGTLITDDTSAPTVAPSTGGVPQWLFKVATYGVIAAGSGTSPADVWNYDISGITTTNTAGKTLTKASKPKISL